MAETKWNRELEDEISTSLRFSDLLVHRHPGELDHLAPLLGFVGNELAELGRRHRLRDTAGFGEPSHQLRILQRFADRLVKGVDDFGRRALRRGDAVESDRSNPGTVSAMAGISGTPGQRCGEVTPSARTVPPRDCSNAEGRLSKINVPCWK